MPEINSLPDTGIDTHATTAATLNWDDPALRTIIRIRYLADSWRGPFFDLSYALGIDRDGNQVHVRIPVYQVVGTGKAVLPALIDAAKRDGIYLKGKCGGDVRDVLSLSW